MMNSNPIETWILSIGALVCLAGGLVIVCFAAIGVAMAAETAIIRWRGAKQLWDLALRERAERRRERADRLMRMTQKAAPSPPGPTEAL